MSQKKDRLTMRESIMYQLLQNLEKGNVHIPVFAFMGDVYSEELKKGGFVSHECSARLSEIRKRNPDLLDVKKQKARYTNNQFYCYRLRSDFTLDSIIEKDLKQFTKELDVRYKPQPPAATTYCPHGLPTFVSCPNCNK